MDVDAQTSQDFRVLVKVDDNNKELMKCFIYINVKKMKLVKDVEDHIKSILDLKVVTLFVNDAWLPSNETVKIINEKDTIIVKVASQSETLDSISKTVTEEEEKEIKRKRKKKDKVANYSLLLLQKELEMKRNELLQKENKSPAKLEATNDTNDDFCTFLPVIPKKKRIRKHKKKAPTNTSVEEIKPASHNRHKKVKLLYSGVHMRFSDDNEESAENPLVEGYKSNDVESSTIVKNLENAEMVKNVECLTNEIALPVETSPSLQDTNKNEKAFNMDISDLETTDQLNQNNKISPVTENGAQVKEVEKQTDNKSDDTPELLDDNWKVKLLNLINQDLESKVFHRKLPVKEPHDVKETV